MQEKIPEHFDLEQLVVDVVSAEMLDEKQSERIVSLLSKALSVHKIILNVKIDKSLIAGFKLQIASCFLDFSLDTKLQKLQSFLENVDFNQLENYDFDALFAKWKEKQKSEKVMQRIGIISSIKDGVVRIKGMRQVKAGELIKFSHDAQGIVFTLNTDYTDVVLLSGADVLKEGDLAYQTGAVVQVPMFIETDEVLRIDTRTGSYIERA